MKNRKIVCLAAALSIFTTNLFAQAMPGFAPSATSVTTQELFLSDSDNFISPRNFNRVEFDRFFATASFVQGNRVNVGYAFNVGNLYFALAYSGFGFANRFELTYSLVSVDDWATSGNRRGGVMHFAAVPNLPGAAQPENNFGVLVGLENFGIRFALSSSRQSFSGDETIFGPIAGATHLANWETSYGSLTPQLAFGFTEYLLDAGIRPWITFGLEFFRDFYAFEVAPPPGATTDLGTQIQRANNYTQFDIDLGLGGFSLINGETFNFYVDLDLSFNVRSFNNDFSFVNAAGNWETNQISGTFAGGVFSERSWNRFNLMPHVGGEWLGEALSLAYNFALPITITNQSEQVRTLDGTTGNFTNIYTDESSTTVELNPVLSLGLMWALRPAITLNAGGSARLGTLGRTTTEVVHRGAPTTDDDFETIQRIRGPNAGINSLFLGFAWSPIENVSFEATSGVTAGNNAVNLFGIGAAFPGLFTFTTIGVNVRF